MMARLLVQFAQSHEAFKRPEIAALAAMVGPEATAVLEAHPFTDGTYLWEATWPSVDLAKQVVRRATLVHLLYKVIDGAASLDALFDGWNAHGPPVGLADFSATTTYRFVVAGHRRHLDWPYQQEVITRIMDCASLPFGSIGKVDLKTPSRIFRILVVYADDSETAAVLGAYLLEEVCEGNRGVLEPFKLTKRPYLGTTSMDTELAFLMANQALARPGALIIDPFVGTGSILLPMTHFGAFTVGVELDPRVLRGSGKPIARNKPGTNVLSNFHKFSVQHLADALIADAAHMPWRTGPLFDAIVTDPPYGVREGARQLAPRVEGTEGVDATVRKVGYETIELLTDLLQFAARQLVVGGRLVYWLATTRDTFHADDIPLHPAMQLLHATPQHFSKWSRHLVTMAKVREPLPTDRVRIPTVEQNRVPSFSAFRDTYFAPTALHDPALTEGVSHRARKKLKRQQRAAASAAATAEPHADMDEQDLDEDDVDDVDDSDRRTKGAAANG